MGSVGPISDGRRQHRAHLLALEPRMMFDAAAAVTAQALASDGAAGADPSHVAAPEALPFADRPAGGATVHLPAYRHAGPEVAIAPRAADRDLDGAARDVRDTRTDAAVDRGEPAIAASGRPIIFIDTSVAEYRQLAAEWADKGTVVLIDGSSDGLDQVRAALAGQSDVAAIHIVSHGAEGVLWLGTTRIDQASIQGDLAATLGAIGRSLQPGGDILLYGCDFAEGDDGAAALHAFAQATHADVAASTDLTGAARLGGDWTLEAHDGAIQAAALAARDWNHTLDPNAPIPIAVGADSLTVTYNNATVVSGSTGYGTDARSPDVGQGAVARWTGVATYQGQSLDLVATVVSLSSGDAIRFNRPTSATNGDDPTFLLRDLTTDGDAQVQIVWSLVKSGTNDGVPADVEFGILDIDGIGGQPFTRESVSASTQGLSYYSREQDTDIFFQSSLDTITASGTQNENTTANQPLSTKSEATFDWKNVSSWTLTYTLTKNGLTSQAQFYQDGNFDFHYTNPVYTSVPRLDLDADDSTAPGNDAHFTYTGNGPASPIVDSDVRVSNPMAANSVTGGTVTLTNAKAGDQLLVGTLPGSITAATTTGNDGSIIVTLSGAGSESDYDQAFRAITFANSNHAPDATQRVVAVSFHNDTLTSAVATSRIDVIPVNAAPARQGTLADQASQDAATVSYATAQAFSDADGDALTYGANGLPAGLSIDATTGVISGTLNRSASQLNGGHYTVVVTATDPSNAATTQQFALAVTNPPPVAQDDSASTNENTPVTIAVLANDSDPDGDPLTVTAATAQHGSVARNGDGTVTYTPTTYFYGTDTIDYTISDGQGGTSHAQVTVTVAHVNQPPQVNNAIPSTVNARDGQTINVSIASVFSDPDGDTLTYGATGLPAGLTLDPSTGRVTGTLDRSASQVNGGSYPVTLTATDPSGASASRTVTLAVANPPPVAQDDSATTDENVPVTVDVLANDSDPDGDPLTVTAASAQHGSVVRNPDGTLTYTPDTWFHGPDTIAYTISDGQGGTSSAQVAVTVNHVNQAPQRNGSLPDQAARDADRVSYATAQAFGDPDGDALVYTASGLPTGLTIDAATGVISGTLDRSASQANGGGYSVVVTATDPSGLATTQGFALTVTNPPPDAVDDAAFWVHPGDSRTIAVLANDSDPDGDPLTVVAASAAHGSVVVNADGTIRYTADAGYAGSDTIHYTISDGQGGSDSAVVPVSIGNAAPTADPLPDQAATDAQAISLPLAGAFHDADGDTLTYAASGLPAGLTIDPATGAISGTIDRSASQANGGVYASQVTADDGHGGTVTAPLRWTISNPSPVARNDGATTAEDTPVAIAVLANDSDPDGDPLTVTAATAGHGSVAINPDGTITYTPAADYSGADTIHYTISDGQGGTSSADVAVTITPVNDAPRAVGTLPARTADDGGSVSIATAGGFADVDGDPLTYSAQGLPAGLSIDPATGVVSGRLAPDVSQHGPYAITITATDPSQASTTQTFALAARHPAPVAADDSATTPQEVPVTIAVLANDTSPSGAPLSVTGATAGHGTVAINPDGTLTYTPAYGYRGTDTIHYTVGDAEGGSAGADVAVTVTPVDHAPVATAPIAAAAANDGSGVRLDLGGYFADRDGDPLRYGATGLPAGLSIDPATGVVTGTLAHDASRTAPYHVTVTATDPSGQAVASSFDWTIVHPAPTPQDDAAATAASVPVAIAVLANDGDPAGDPLAVTAASAAHGSVAIGADGVLRYTPAAGFTGQDVVTYTVTDSDGGTASARLLVTVTPPPVAGDGTAATIPGDAVTIPVLSLASDPAGLPLAVTAVAADHGTAMINPDDTVRYVPGAGFTGTDTVRYTVADRNGGTATALVAVSVAPPDRPPVVPDRAPVAAIGGQPLRLNLLAGATDPDGDPLTIVAASAAVGTLSVAPDGTATFAAPLGFAGTTTLTYTVSDGRGGLTDATLVIRVADGRGADIDELLRIGHPRIVDPTPSLARVAIGPGGEIANPLVLLRTVEAIRPLNPTAIGEHPVGDAVDAVRALGGTAVDPAHPIGDEVARLDALPDRRDEAGRLIDHRWSDFLVKGLTGFSAAADGNAGIMVDSVIRGHAIYLEVRDTAAGRLPAIRSVDVRLARGGCPDWIRVDHRGLAIVERAADRDELHLVVRVTRADGRASATPVVVQGATGEIELDRAPDRHAPPLDATLAHPNAAFAAEADRLARSFQ